MTRVKVQTVTSRTCRQCGKEFALTNYGGRKRVYCDKDCANAWLQKNRPRPSRAGAQNYDRAMYLIMRYGITEDDYAKMLAEQDGKCNICGSTQVNRGLHTNLFVDHSHTTGDIRGLVCNICNRQLAWLENNWDKIMTHLSTKKDL